MRVGTRLADSLSSSTETLSVDCQDTFLLYSWPTQRRGKAGDADVYIYRGGALWDFELLAGAS